MKKAKKIRIDPNSELTSEMLARKFDSLGLVCDPQLATSIHGVIIKVLLPQLYKMMNTKVRKIHTMISVR